MSRSNYFGTFLNISLMQPFSRGYVNYPSRAKFVREQHRLHGITIKEAKQHNESLLEEEIWINDLYQVNIHKTPVHNFSENLIHLSIKRQDKKSLHDWRDLQEIKNMLVGPECEAIELYPAESRLVDTANQYHLWCFTDPKVRLPVGWTTRLVYDNSYGGATQRPRKNNEP